VSTYIKFLRADGCGPYSNKPWSLPTEAAPGEWMPKQRISLCESGYHATTLENALEWLSETAYVVEYRDEPEHGGTKVVGAEARLLYRLPWHDRSARHFSADCAERVLPIFLLHFPDDDRPRAAIQAARDFADGRIGADARAAARADARDAAWDAAWAAAWDAAGAAAGDAHGRWQTWQLGRYLFGDLRMEVQP